MNSMPSDAEGGDMRTDDDVIRDLSKRLTQMSKTGSEESIRKDFQGAVQDAYDQAFSCAQWLLDGTYRLLDESGNEILLPSGIVEVTPVCVVADHYPALSLQAGESVSSTLHNYFDDTAIPSHRTS